MADNFPNLPGINVSIQDGNLRPETVPVGPAVVVLGTATKGPSKVETRLATAPTALSRFGLSGTLARGAVEVFQGGGDNVVAFRVLATEGKIEHIGDITGVGGYTIETIGEGSDILEKISVLYDNAEDLLKVYDVASGILVFSNDPDAPVDLGIVSVTGSKALDNPVGSIGLKVPLKTVEDDQTFRVAALTPTELNLDASCNAALLRWNATTNPCVVQVLNALGDSLLESIVTAVDVAAKTVTITDALTVGAGAAEFAAATDHKVRFISTLKPVRADRILADRLYETAASGVQSLLVTPGSDFNGLAKVTNEDGLTADLDVDEVAPAKMNMYEALEDSFLALEASQFGGIVMPGVYLDDPALDGETTGDTAVPAEFFNGDVPTVATLEGFADRCVLTFVSRADAVTLLEAAGRGAVWMQFTEPKGEVFGDNLDPDEEGTLVRTARVLNWENAAGAQDLTVFFDRDVSFSVDADGVVVVDQDPVVASFKTDQLFYHRAVEVDGELVHMWYSETSDPDGFEYHEVNFAYRLAKFCDDMTSNESSVTGVIGVRPPSNHFNPAAIANWIGKSPLFDVDGNVSTNGTGLLGNKFISGAVKADTTQFSPGFKQTENGELDDSTIMLDGNGFEIDMGKFISVVATWPVLTNSADSTGLGYINSGAALYAGLLANLPSWRGATAKPIGGRGIRLAAKLAKRHQNSLAGARFVLFDSRPENVIVVDAPSAALPTSDFTRNMTVRLTAEAVQICRNVARPFLGDPLSGVRRAALETALKKGLSDLQRVSGGALESFDMSLTQSALDKRRGTAKLTLTLQIINELRKITVDVALTK